MKTPRTLSALVLLSAVLCSRCANQDAVGPPANLALLDPGKWTAKAPDSFAVKLETTKGDVVLDVHRDWAPLGADRFYNLVQAGYYDDNAFFRVLTGFVAQVGINGNPQVNAAWQKALIKDDPTGKQSNLRGTLTFATSGQNSRTTQIFINYAGNTSLDGMGFAPFALARDMAVAEKWEAGYGEGAPSGNGPSQSRIQNEGNPYLKAEFPKLDYIKKAGLMP